MLKLGSKEYAFALDAVPPPAKKAKPDDKKTTKEKSKTDKAAAGSTTYNRLYFDLNHNGDLTDDKPIDAETAQGARRWGSFFQFPRVDVVLDEAGTKLDYSFFLAGQQLGASRDLHYVTLSMTPGVYREGQITLAGKKRHVVLIDYNSNGRFNDEMNLPKDLRTATPQLSVEPGDMLLIDPKAGVSNDGQRQHALCVETGQYRRPVLRNKDFAHRRQTHADRLRASARQREES